MDNLRELLQVDSMIALNFFHEGLGQVAPKQLVGQDETVYVASILAHYAQTSRSDTGPMPSPATFVDIFDQFVLEDGAGADPELLETVGSWSLLLLGLSPRHPRLSPRHNIQWYTQLGRSFYAKASRNCPDQQRRVLLKRISGNFTIWTFACQKFYKNLREAPLLIH